MHVLKRPPSGWPALVLNADFRPLSYYPLSLWPWQEVVKSVFLDRVEGVSFSAFAQFLAARGIAISSGATIRLVTHLDVSRFQITQVIEAAKQFLAQR